MLAVAELGARAKSGRDMADICLLSKRSADPLTWKANRGRCGQPREASESRGNPGRRVLFGERTAVMTPISAFLPKREEAGAEHTARVAPLVDGQGFLAVGEAAAPRFGEHALHLAAAARLDLQDGPSLGS